MAGEAAGLPDSRQLTIDTGLWWHANKDKKRNLEHEVEFLRTFCDCMMATVATLATEFQDFKTNSKTQSDTHLFLPKGLHIEKDHK